MVHEDPWHAGNPYIYTLIDGIRKQFPDVVFGWGRDAFWDKSILSFDIVHFHWPQAFMAGEGGLHSLDDLKRRINQIKNNNIAVVATCHDLAPHYQQCIDCAEALSIVYEQCDAVFHLGEYSKALFEKKFPKAKHLLLPHHVYDTVYDPVLPDKLICKKALGLNRRHRYILCFGSFRSDEERDFVKYVSRKLKRNIHILAPSFREDISFRRGGFKLFVISCLIRLVDRYYYRIHMTGKSWAPVSDDVLPYYYGACELAFVHRLKILNSGNAILPLLFGKLVVGPDIGNVGLFLREYGFPVFDINNEESAVRCLKAMLESEYRTEQSHNDIWRRNLSTAHVSGMLYNYYLDILINR